MLDPVFFWAAKDPFSNFYPSPIVIDGKRYATVEHYYQAQKFLYDSELYELVAKSDSPEIAKALARQYAELIRPDWDDVKDEVMGTATHAKYVQHPELLQLLLDTGERELVENSPDDAYWGRTPLGGLNKMGLILMKIRQEFRRP